MTKKTKTRLDPTKRDDIILAFNYLKRKNKKYKRSTKSDFSVVCEVSEMLKVPKTTVFNQIKNRKQEPKHSKPRYYVEKVDSFDRSLILTGLDVFNTFTK